MQKISKIEIITRPEKLDALKNALYAIRVTGMTVSQVYGCGLSHGHTEVYRGQKIAMNQGRTRTSTHIRPQSGRSRGSQQASRS